MTPAGLAYLTMPLLGNLLDDADALLAQRVAQDAEHLGAARRLAAAHAALVDAHVGEADRRLLVAAGPGDGPAQAIDRRPGRRPRSRASRRARVPTSVVRRAPVSSGVIVRRCHATAMSLRSAGGTPSYSTANLMRIGFSRVYSSSTSALRPATRPMMNMKLAGRRREAQVVQDRGERAVDVHRERLDARGGLALRARAHEARCRRRRACSCRRGSNSTATRGSTSCARDGRDPGSRRFARTASSTSSRRAASSGASSVARAALEACRDQLHAARAGAAVLVADREDAGGDRRGERLPVARGREPRRRARRRAGAVIGHADQDGVEQPPLARRRQPFEMQQEDQVGERRLAASAT